MSASGAKRTSDNFPLSGTGTPLPCGHDFDPAVAEYLLASRAPNTHRAYAFDLADFQAWGGSVPSSPEEIASYLASRAGQLRPSTLKRRVAALASAHRDQGYADPTKAVLVRRVIQDIERRHGKALRQVQPILIDDLARIVGLMGNSRVELRDKAILLVGFFGALRRSEIVALDVQSLEQTNAGLSVTIVRSKTDQTGSGRTVRLTARDDLLCPVAAVALWLKVSSLESGPLFRPCYETDIAEGWRLSSRAVARLIKRHAAHIGLDPTRYSGHSLRAGFVTTAALAGAEGSLIARQTGHRTQVALTRYVRPLSGLNLQLMPAPEHLTVATARSR